MKIHTALTLGFLFFSSVSPSRLLSSAVAQTPQADQALETLRQDWRNRNPLLKGQDFIQEETQFQQRVSQIVNLYTAALKDNPKNVDALLGLAEVKYIYLKRFEPVKNEDILALLQEAIKLNPKHSRAQITLAEFLYFHVPEFKKQPTQEMLQQQQKLQRSEALQAMEKAHQLQPHHVDLSITYADLLSYEPYLKDSAYTQAYQILEEALKAHPNNDKLLLMQGRVLVRHALKDPDKPDTTQFESAKTHFAKVFQAAPQNTTAYLELAQVQLQLKDVGGAIESLRALLKVDPKDTKALFLLAETLIKSEQKAFDREQVTPGIAEAQRHYRTLMSDLQTHQMGYSEQVVALNNLGLISYAQGQGFEKAGERPAALNAYRDAIGHYEKAVDIFDKIKLVNSLIQQELAKSLLAHGRLLKQTDPDTARSELQKACDLKLETACKAL